jgi:hypothetical protein
MKKQMMIATQSELNSNTAAAWTGDFKDAVNSKDAVAARLATLKEINKAAVKRGFMAKLLNALGV